jgi:hypothetical protein
LQVFVLHTNRPWKRLLPASGRTLLRIDRCSDRLCTNDCQAKPLSNK